MLIATILPHSISSFLHINQKNLCSLKKKVVNNFKKIVQCYHFDTEGKL